MGVSTREYTLPVYIYDADKGGKGKKLGHQIPSWIVRKVNREHRIISSKIIKKMTLDFFRF